MADGKRRAIDSALARPTAIVVVGQVPPHPSFWDGLPDELVELILSKLDGVTLWKGTVEQINRRLRDILRTSPVIQRAKFAERWDGYAIGRLRPQSQKPIDRYNGFVNYLAVGQFNEEVKVYRSRIAYIDVWSGTPLSKSYELVSQHVNVSTIEVNNANGNVYIGWSDGAIEVRSGKDGRLLSTLDGHTDTVHAIAVGSSGEKVYSGGEDGTIRVWDGDTDKHLYTLEGHTDAVISLAIGGGKVYSGSNDKTVRVWRESDGNHLHTIDCDDGPVVSLAFCKYNNRLYGFELSNIDIRVWSGEDYSELDSLHMPRRASFWPIVAVDRNGNVYTNGGGVIWVWKRGDNKGFLVLGDRCGVLIAVGPDNRLYSDDGHHGIRVW
jgi:WD40 repeat protein